MSDWSWQIRRSHFVLVGPSGEDQVRVSRKDFAACAALVRHEKRWGEILDRSRAVTGSEAEELTRTLAPFFAPEGTTSKRRAKRKARAKA